MFQSWTQWRWIDVISWHDHSYNDFIFIAISHFSYLSFTPILSFYPLYNIYPFLAISVSFYARSSSLLLLPLSSPLLPPLLLFDLFQLIIFLIVILLVLFLSFSLLLFLFLLFLSFSVLLFYLFHHLVLIFIFLIDFVICRCELRDPTGGCVSDVAWNPDQGMESIAHRTFHHLTIHAFIVSLSFSLSIFFSLFHSPSRFLSLVCVCVCLSLSLSSTLYFSTIHLLHFVQFLRTLDIPISYLY